MQGQGKHGVKSKRENLTFIRVSHWVFALAVFFLMASGSHIFNPRVEALWPMATARFIHLSMAAVLVSALGAKAYYTLARGDPGHYLFSRRDLKTLLPCLKYYLFISSTPRSLLPRYDFLHKSIFFSWLILFPLLVLTGLVILDPGLLTPLLARLGDLQTFRHLHFGAALGLVITVPLHIYLNLTEDFPRVSALLSKRTGRP